MGVRLLSAGRTKIPCVFSPQIHLAVESWSIPSFWRKLKRRYIDLMWYACLSGLLGEGAVLNNSAFISYFALQTPSGHCDHEPLDKAVSLILMLSVELRRCTGCINIAVRYKVSIFKYQWIQCSWLTLELAVVLMAHIPAMQAMHQTVGVCTCVHSW